MKNSTTDEKRKYTPKPDWLRTSLNTTSDFHRVSNTIEKMDIHTVCQEAKCPNLEECWGTHRTASFMILGDTCTRRCRFCAVKTGLPGPVDLDEPRRVAEAVKSMDLSHVVVTMVNRDDLDHGGSWQMAQTVSEIRSLVPSCTVELLSSDMMGKIESIARMVEAQPDILSHNLETVRRLTPRVRSRSDYDRSLEFLATVHSLNPQCKTKSSLMLGLGEEDDEVLRAMDDLLGAGVRILNMGQYLQPTRNHLPVVKYRTPYEFHDLKMKALQKGFLHVEAGPLVRSSYHAADQIKTVNAALEEENQK
ncbi:lipoyl synthase [Oceanispirochaeta crateris]|uniref:Lipoyl synthase n=1 Tax=Oceanispirochaeta crateris TaxID=2518645 RepID=A0A5C1QT11_9SPIO|nr:lipoyl synthase [Oceanispirochaeta crateris]QEN09696.1 lipoyl synthase [Oceanispirochaeta crateris]